MTVTTLIAYDEKFAQASKGIFKKCEPKFGHHPGCVRRRKFWLIRDLVQADRTTRRDTTQFAYGRQFSRPRPIKKGTTRNANAQKVASHSHRRPVGMLCKRS